MKKVITVCLCLILALSVLVGACAEDFTIHAGTMFGDTREEVKSKENLELHKEVASNANDSEYTKDVGEDIAYMLFEGTVAGYDNVEVQYFFNGDNNDSLFEVVYIMPEDVSVGAGGVVGEYKDLLDNLTEKYGAPLSNEDEVYYLIISRFIQEQIWTNEYFQNEGLPFFAKDITYDAWAIPCDGYNVKIELVMLGNGESCNIVYHRYSDEEVDAARVAYENAQNKKKDDL